MTFFFDEPTKNVIGTYKNIRKTGQGDDYMTDCLLDYPYFNKSYKVIAIDLRKQRALELIQKQYNRLTLLQFYIVQEIQQCF